MTAAQRAPRQSDERNHSRRRIGRLFAPDHLGNLKAARSHLLQADDLLPALDAGQFGNQQHPHHHHTGPRHGEQSKRASGGIDRLRLRRGSRLWRARCGVPR